MEHKETFRSGAALKAVWWSERREGFDVVFQSVESITVETVYGQCCRVPWARVKFNNGAPDRMLNLALMEDVELAKEADDG